MRSGVKVGVIGYGSIGKRHCDNLLSLGINDIILFREKSQGNELGLKEEYDFEKFTNNPFAFIIISNPTSKHFEYLEYFIKHNYNIIVEKPISATSTEYHKLKELLYNYTGVGMCAYNLRFHPAIAYVKTKLESDILGQIYSARFFVGQYLPDWRPNVDYRNSYSSKSELGGGVTLDLSHELDLAYYFFGKVSDRFHSISVKISNLEINSEDITEVHYQTKGNTIISVHLDYLVRGYSRYFEIIGEKARVHCDLSSNKVQIIGDNNIVIDEIEFDNFERNNMYFEMISGYVNSIKHSRSVSPTLEEGLYPLKLSLAIKNQIDIYE